jgi:hypothetical protein
VRREWLAPLTGVAFIALVIISGIVMGEPPDADSPVQEIVDHYQDNEDSIYLGAFIGVAGMVLLIFFGSYLSSLFRAAEGPGMLSVLPLVGLSIVAVGGAIDTTISIALVEAVDDIEPDGVQALQALWDNDFIPFVVGSLTFLFSTGLLVVRTGVLPRWLGWVALVLAVVGLTPVGFIAFVGAGLWILIVSVLLTVRARRPVTPTATPAA